MRRGKIRLVIGLTSIFLIFVVLAGWYFLFTTKGSTYLAKKALSAYVESKNINIKEVEGTIAEMLAFNDIEIKDLKFLPPGSEFKIQRLEFYLAAFSWEGINVKIHNGRLVFPGIGLIFFYGGYKDTVFNLNVYSKRVSVRDVLDLFAQSEYLRNVSGVITDLDVYVKGALFAPELSGKLLVENVARGDFFLANCPADFKLQFKDIKSKMKLYGEILLKGGQLSGAKTAAVNLEPSKILFAGDFKSLSLDFKGSSSVEDVKINMALKGTLRAPDLKVSSQPSLPQERLLVMLATNKQWEGTETSIRQGVLPADLAADFIDYFAFGGRGSKIARQLGVSELSLKFNDETKGISLKKDLTENQTLNYGVEQVRKQQGELLTMTHKVGGEYQITETISIGVEAQRQVKQDIKTSQQESKPKVDDKVFLKIKKDF